MKLLALEASQNKRYYLGRYQQLTGLGVDLHVLNGIGTDDFWPAGRYRRAGSTHVDDIVRHAAAWHAEEHFDGVCTFSESAVVLVAATATALGLPGIGVQAAITSRNKLFMRQAHERGGVAHPSFRFVTDVGTALQTAAEFGYPVIIKPTLGAASNFVFRVDTPGQLRERFAQAWAGIDSMIWYNMEAQGIDLGPHGLLIESFLDGHEHLIEALAWDDEVYLGSIVDRVTVEGDTFDDDVHHAPTVLSAEQIAEVHALVTAGMHAQQLTHSVGHAEVRFHRGKPHLIEIAVRPGGGGLDYMARISAGYDPIKAVADVAAGARPDVHHFRPTEVHTAAMCLLSPGGTIDSISVPPEVSGSQALYYITITAKHGDRIRRPPEGNQTIGGLGALGHSFDEAMQSANDLAGKIEVKMAE